MWASRLEWSVLIWCFLDPLLVKGNRRACLMQRGMPYAKSYNHTLKPQPGGLYSCKSDLLNLFLPWGGSPSKPIALEHLLQPPSLLFSLNHTALGWETEIFALALHQSKGGAATNVIFGRALLLGMEEMNLPSEQAAQMLKMCCVISFTWVRMLRIFCTEWHISFHFSVVLNSSNLERKHVTHVEKPGGCLLWRLFPDFLYLW